MTDLPERIEVLMLKLRTMQSHVRGYEYELPGEREKISTLVAAITEQVDAANERLRTMISAEEARWWRDDWHQAVS